MAWTQEKIDKMMAWMKEGRGAGYVGNMLGYSRNAVIGKYSRERVKRGLIPPRPSDCVSRHVRMPEIPLPDAREPGVSTAPVGFVMPKLTAVPRIDDRTRIGILDVTGCRWCMGEDASVIGGMVFCNAEPEAGAPYCAAHVKKATASYSRELIRSTVRSTLHTLKKGRAA